MPNTLYFSAEGDATTKIVQFYHPVLQTWVDGTLVDSVTKKYTATMAGIPAGFYTGLKSRLKGSSPEIIKIYSEGVTVRDGNTTTPPTGTKASVPVFGTLDDINNIVGLTSAYSYTEVMWGPEGGTMQQLASNSICSPGNIAGRLQAYVVANTAAGRLQSDTVYSAPFTMAAAVNNAPTATISVVGGTTTILPGQSVTLQLGGADVDAGDNLVKIDALDNGVKIGEITGAIGSLQTIALTAGSHSFTARSYDSKGATGLSTAVLVKAEPAAGGGTEPTRLPVTRYNQSYNYREEANNGGLRYNANTMFSVLVNSSLLSVDVYGFNQAGYDMNAGSVWVDGKPFQLLGDFADGKTGAQTYNLTNIPGTGYRRVDIYSAGHQNVATTKPFTNYVSLVAVVVPTGSAGQIIAPVKKLAECGVVWGDSLTQAGGTNDPAMAWTRILNRDLRPNCDIYSAGHSAGVISRLISTEAGRRALLAEYKATRAGYQKAWFWYASMVNDAYFAVYTPAQLAGFYSAFIALFLEDLDILNDVIYFQTAITRAVSPTSPQGEGNNSLGYPLGAYRDAMNGAVLAAASPRVKSADGPKLADPKYLALPKDGTHQIGLGDIDTAVKISNLLNQSGNSTGSLSQVNGVQAGRKLTLSTDSLQAVKYKVDSGAYQSSIDFLNLAAGQHTISAQLVDSPYTVVSNTITVNGVLYGAQVTKNGPGWVAGVPGDPFSGWFSDGSGISYEFTFTDGFVIYQNRQENIPEFYVSIDNGPAIRVAVSGPGFDYTEVRTYISERYTDGVTHTCKVTPGVSTSMNFYAVERFGPATGTAPVETPIFKDPEFDSGLVSDITQGWIAATGGTATPGGTATIIDGQAVISAGNNLAQVRDIVVGGKYRFEVEIASVQNGAFVSIGGTGGSMQLNTYYANSTTIGGSAGLFTREVVAEQGGSCEFYVQVTAGTAYVKAARLFRLS